jgi:hypothetical protein
MSRSSFSLRKMFILAAVLILILVSIACGAGSAPQLSGSAPLPSETGIAFMPTVLMPVVESTSQPTQIAAAPAIPETRRLTLEFPSKMRAGVEGDIIRLTLEVDDLGNITPTAQIEGNVVVGKTIEIPDLYETHNVTAEAQLDLAGMLVQPADAIYEPLKRGQSATFYWSIRPQETGMVDFFGLSVNMARTSGVIGSIVGGVVGFPFIEDIIKFLFKRRKKKM